MWRNHIVKANFVLLVRVPDQCYDASIFLWECFDDSQNASK